VGSSRLYTFAKHCSTDSLLTKARASLLSVDKDPDALDRAQTITNDLMKDPDSVVSNPSKKIFDPNASILL
jgi:hypothetical protein